MQVVELIIVACAAAGLLISVVGLTRIFWHEGLFSTRDRGKRVPDKQARSQTAGN